MITLGIETSCDETGIGLFDHQSGLLGHLLHSQIDLHAAYGGVVPELASRDHIRLTSALIKQLLEETGVTKKQLTAIAYTAGPGLMGALMVGASVAASMAWALHIPALPIHHMEAHLLAPMMQQGNTPDFPFIALLVSGGHTMLIRVEGVGEYRLLGQSLDDAAGEAFDKTAKLLDLGYPGGPSISLLAESGRADRFTLTRPMVNRPGLDFSFSGLKTQVRNLLQSQVAQNGALDQQTRTDIAAVFEQTFAETMVIKCRRALQQEHLSRLVVSGGVSANRKLRQSLGAMADDLNADVHFPDLEFCTDNGAMIAFAGAQRLADGLNAPLDFKPKTRWSLEDLRPPGWVDKADQSWAVYIIQASDKSYYTGITTDVERRWKEHQAGKGAKYFRGKNPELLVYVETDHSRSSASIREAEIKKLSRAEKIELIRLADL